MIENYFFEKSLKEVKSKNTHTMYELGEQLSEVRKECDEWRKRELGLV